MSPTKHALQMGCQNSRTVMILTLNIPPISEMMYKKFELIRLTSTTKKTDPKQKITHVIFIVFFFNFCKLCEQARKKGTEWSSSRYFFLQARLVVMRGYWVQIWYKSHHHSLRNRPSSKAFQLKIHHFFLVTLMSRLISMVITSRISTQYAHISYRMIAQWFLNMASKFQVITSKRFDTRAWRVNSIKKRFNSAFQFSVKFHRGTRIKFPLHAVSFGSC